jgi:aspartyl-tRNA(Asn)/glutamyl-tRNA(Gln) amidotransferase subunit A
VLQRQLFTVFDHADVVLVPTTPASAPPFDGMRLRIGDHEVPWVDVVAKQMFFFNVVGAPAVSVPAGLDRHGMPIGVQLAAAPFREDLCLRAAAAIEQVTDHHRAAPAFAISGLGDQA